MKSLTIDWAEWVDALGCTKLPARAFNPYRLDGGANCRIRRNNLLLYLGRMYAHRAKQLLVGEAYGYRGGRVTGVPFTSQRLLGEHPWYRSQPYAAVLGDFPQAEATATILQSTLSAIGERPLLWNAFPFHPHQPGRPQSNRKPTVAELRIGQPVLVDLIERFEIEQVIALGNSAADSLRRLGIEHVKVRHPSQGGKRDFVAGLTQIFGG